MNQIVNKFLLAEDKFISEVDLRQPIEHDESEFKYSACGQFTKNMERVQTLHVFRKALHKSIKTPSA